MRYPKDLRGVLGTVPVEVLPGGLVYLEDSVSMWRVMQTSLVPTAGSDPRIVPHPCLYFEQLEGYHVVLEGDW